MPSAVTTYGATYFLNTLFGQENPPPPFFYVALLTQAPGTQTDGSLLVEPDPAAGYTRAQLINDQNAWGTAVDGVIASTAQVVYPVASADWPTVTHYALCDTLFGGNVYLYGNFIMPRRVLAGDQARLPAQALSLSIGSLSSAVSSTF